MVGCTTNKSRSGSIKDLHAVFLYLHYAFRIPTPHTTIRYIIGVIWAIKLVAKWELYLMGVSLVLFIPIFLRQKSQICTSWIDTLSYWTFSPTR